MHYPPEIVKKNYIYEMDDFKFKSCCTQTCLWLNLNNVLIEHQWHVVQVNKNLRSGMSHVVENLKKFTRDFLVQVS